MTKNSHNFTSDKNQQLKAQSEQSIRLWPVAIITVLDVMVLSWIWFFYDNIRQIKVIDTVLSQFITFLLLILWLLFLSGLRLRIRLTSFALVVVTVTLLATLFRVRGITGDFVPLLTWRWAPNADETLEIKPQVNPDGWAIKPDLQPSTSPYYYPQFLGPQRNATLHGIKLARDWSTRPPKSVWRQPIGAGWSAFAVVEEFAVTQEQRGSKEMVVCYDLKTGQVKWTHSDNGRYESVIAGDGPRATPTINRGRVYTMGATGVLNCLALSTGKRIWTKNILQDNHSKNPEWGKSCSPLVIENLVIVSAGGTNGSSLVAYHTNTGEVVWCGGNDRSGYSSPLITTLAGVRQILILNRASVAAHNPSTGQILWQHPWPNEQPNVAQPVPLPSDRVFVSSGYGVGCKLFEIKYSKDGGLSPILVWETPRLKAKFTNVVYQDGYIYGLDDGILVCLDITNGQRRWKRGRYGHGQIILVDDLLLVQTEKGDIVLVEANPEAHKELSRFSALKGKTWNNHALAGPYLLVRNDQEAACYKLPLAQ